MSDATEVTLTIDGTDVTVPAGTTIWEAARETGIEIPALCHDPRLRPVGVCRMCVVDVGERVLAASCVRACSDGMTVDTCSETVEGHRRTLTELLLSEYPETSAREETTDDDALLALAERYEVSRVGCAHQPQPDTGSSTRWAQPTLRADNPQSAIPNPQFDDSSPVIAVDHAACILCDRCIRACDDVQSNEVIGRTGKGHAARIAFDLDAPMGDSTCVSCGECVAACPTGALVNKPITLPIVSRDGLEPVESVCPYCGVGCAITYWVEDGVDGRSSMVDGAAAASPSPINHQPSTTPQPSTLNPQPDRPAIVFAEGRESPVNHGRLCVKGRYGWDYATHPQRLTTPLIRRDDRYPKGPLSPEVASSLHRRPGGIVDYDEVLPAFREATWDEALDLVASRLLAIREEHGPGALAGFGSAKCSNEEAYLFQKLVRAGFGTNNVDHCTRLCHASSVAALMETIGSGAVTNVFADVANADVCLLTGSNAAANHPVAATFVKEAVKNGTTLIVVDVRRHPLAELATHFARIRPGTDVAFYNGVMNVLVRDSLVDEAFVANRTEGYDDLAALVAEYPPEVASQICGVPANEIEAIARTIGGVSFSRDPLGERSVPIAFDADRSPNGSRQNPLPRMLVFWGMGISQHTHGTDNARCLISLCLLTGNVGKPGTGLHPLRGQNNVQGASDAGLIPMVYPDYQSVGDPAIREKFEAAWGVPLDPEPGLTVVEIVAGALKGDVRGMYVLGENPFVSDPNTNKVRRALANLEFLAVQDVFLTETAEFADVILPASSYFEKSGTYTNTDRRVQLGRPVLDLPGEARVDWEIVCEIGRRMGVAMPYGSASDVFDEFASLTSNYATLSHDTLGSTGKLWPCDDPATGDGTRILFGERFPTENGRGKFVPCHFAPPHEPTDDEYPFVLNTGRLLEHWHTGSMTRRSRVLNAIEPTAFAALNPADLRELSIDTGARIRLASRRGEIELAARADDSVDRGSVFVPFHFREAAANVLTTDALDPYGKIPEFKFCAIRVTRA